PRPTVPPAPPAPPRERRARLARTVPRDAPAAPPSLDGYPAIDGGAAAFIAGGQKQLAAAPLRIDGDAALEQLHVTAAGAPPRRRGRGAAGGGRGSSGAAPPPGGGGGDGRARGAPPSRGRGRRGRWRRATPRPTVDWYARRARVPPPLRQAAGVRPPPPAA